MVSPLHLLLKLRESQSNVRGCFNGQVLEDEPLDSISPAMIYSTSAGNQCMDPIRKASVHISGYQLVKNVSECQYHCLLALATEFYCYFVKKKTT